MSGTGNLTGTIPAPATPIADAGGNITVPWRAYLLVLQRRTGGTEGASVNENTARVTAEQNARIAADNGLEVALGAEVTARIAGDEAEAIARANGDAFLGTMVTSNNVALANEIVRATAAEALLVPLDQLCVLWGQCDLSFLPTADPGLGRPWIDGNHVAIGSGLIPVDIGLEDGTGFWTLEGGGDWLWG